MVAAVANNQTSVKSLSYYKAAEVEQTMALPERPDLLLLHDWPVPPAQIENLGFEKQIVERLRPKWVCCGHHHRVHRSRIGASECVALNVIAHEHSHEFLPGWAAVFEQTANALGLLGVWPQ